MIAEGKMYMIGSECRRQSTDLAGTMALFVLVACSRDGADTPTKTVVEKPVDQPKAPLDASGALEHIHLDHDFSYLTELRKLGGRIHDFQQVVKAEAIDPAKCRPVSAVAGFRIEGRPLLWFSPELDRMAVDGKAFTDLKVARAFTAQHGPAEGEVIGRFLGGNALPPRSIVKLLIKGDIIQSNRHTTAEVYLMEETSDESGYRCRIVCEDTYFTNCENVDTYPYCVRIGKDGQIRMTGD